MRDAIEPATPLVIGSNNVPGTILRIRRLEHHVTSARVGALVGVWLQVHRTQLPLATRILDAGFEASPLLRLCDFEPVFEQDDAGLGDVALKFRTVLHEFLVLILVAKTHYIFDTGAVI